MIRLLVCCAGSGALAGAFGYWMGWRAAYKEAVMYLNEGVIVSPAAVRPPGTSLNDRTLESFDGD